MTMLERVRAAIADACCESTFNYQLAVCKNGNTDWCFCRKRALAAVAAMREPTQEMLIAARKRSRDQHGKPISREDASDFMAAIIDAAIDQGFA